MEQGNERKLVQPQSPTLQSRITGKCKSWAKRGYGFIIRDDGEGDVFVHHSHIKKNGFRSLRVGEKVEFDIRDNKMGRKQAVRVTGPGGIDVLGSENLGTTRKQQQTVMDHVASPMVIKYTNSKRQPYGIQLYTKCPAYQFQLESPETSVSVSPTYVQHFEQLGFSPTGSYGQFELPPPALCLNNSLGTYPSLQVEGKLQKRKKY